LHLVGCLCYLYQWCTVKQISDNKIYFLIKYTKSVLCRVAKRLSCIEDARCLKVKNGVEMAVGIRQRCSPSRQQSFGSHTRCEHTTVKSNLDSRQKQTFLYSPQHEKRLWEPSSSLFFGYRVNSP
jgi:hypothetical protein